MKCDRCNGTGTIIEESDNGIGFIPKTCYFCNGTGKVFLLNYRALSNLNLKGKAHFLASICQEAYTNEDMLSEKYWEKWLTKETKDMKDFYNGK